MKSENKNKNCMNNMYSFKTLSTNTYKSEFMKSNA